MCHKWVTGKKEIHYVICVHSNDQLSDCLTKEGASHEKLCDVLIGNRNNKLYLKKQKPKKRETSQKINKIKTKIKWK